MADEGYALALQEKEKVRMMDKAKNLLENQGIEIEYDENGLPIIPDPAQDGFSERGSYGEEFLSLREINPSEHHVQIPINIPYSFSNEEYYSDSDDIPIHQKIYEDTIMFIHETDIRVLIMFSVGILLFVWGLSCRFNTKRTIDYVNPESFMKKDGYDQKDIERILGGLNIPTFNLKK